MPDTLPLQIMDKAVGDHIKAFADAIGRDKSQVYRWLSDPDLDPLTRIDSVLEAIFKVHPEGELLIFQYLESRHKARRCGQLIKGAKWEDVLGDVATTHADAFTEALKKGNDLDAKAATAIRAWECLLAQKRVSG